MNASKPQEQRYQFRVLKSTRQLSKWTGVWVGTVCLMAFGPLSLWNRGSVFTLLAAGLNVCVGLGLILAHKKFLANMDELQRKVYLDALAITVGTVFIIVVPYAVLDAYNFVHLKTGVAISGLVILMSLTFLASLLYGSWRYR
ncbi:MAG: hypothetical protein ABI824_04955 [Acidobacteriota bacterium]